MHRAWHHRPRFPKLRPSKSDPSLSFGRIYEAIEFPACGGQAYRLPTAGDALFS